MEEYIRIPLKPLKEKVEEVKNKTDKKYLFYNEDIWKIKHLMYMCGYKEVFDSWVQ